MTRYEAFDRVVLALVEVEEGKPQAGIESLNRALELGRRYGFRGAAAYWLGYGGILRRFTGEPDEARELLGEAVRRCRDSGHPFGVAVFLAHLASLAAEKGRLDEADALTADAEQLAARTPEADAQDVVRIERGHLDLARAREALRAWRVDEASTMRRAAEARVEAARAPAAKWVEVRMALRLLERALKEAEADAVDGALATDTVISAPVLVVHCRGDWFDLPSGKRVKLEKRRNLRLLLTTLAQRHAEAPGDIVEYETLIEACWPAERILPAAARTRLHSLVSDLRELGLREHVQSAGRGYLFDPDLRVRIVPRG
jgi:hypothetical protein